MRRILIITSFFFGLNCGSHAIYGNVHRNFQNGTGKIKCKITDESGNLLKHASIELSLNGSRLDTTHTNSAGEFFFSGLDTANRYDLFIRLIGYQTTEITSIKLSKSPFERTFKINKGNYTISCPVYMLPGNKLVDDFSSGHTYSHDDIEEMTK